MFIIDEKDFLSHYGTPRHSGRYPYGSGSDEESFRNMTFLDTIDYLKSQGLNDFQIYKGMGSSSTEYRAKKAIEKNRIKQEEIDTAQKLQDKGMGGSEIGRQMGRSESYVRTLLAPGAKEKADALMSISNFLKTKVDADKYIDVGSGVETHLKISKERLGQAVAIAVEQGYTFHKFKDPQINTGFDTERKILAGPGVTQREVFLNKLQIKQVMAFSGDGGHTFGRMDHDPISINPNRIQVKYNNDGGGKADGVIYVRPGIEDISLGQNRYAQVRILVNSTHYLKGMAMYKDDLPKGVDLIFHTSKDSTGNKLDAMKPIESNKDYPFGSVIHQLIADPGTENERVTSAMNMVGGKAGAGEEGSWGTWKRTLSAQILSKQSPILARQQLDMTYEDRKRDFDEINSLTNPTVKKKLLESFADDSDAASVHLKAAIIPRSSWHAILPIDSMPPNQIFAPNFNNGERVALIRYPHGGKFEIPELIVNNNQPEAKKLLGGARDAVGIHISVAERLSGADFDGDTVLVIPNDSGKIKTDPALEGLKGFNPKRSYPPFNGMDTIDGGTYNTETRKVDFAEGKFSSGTRKQAEMGKISNLITDMTLKGAPNTQIVRAIRHSMVVIDSEKHSLNIKQSAIDNNIRQLKAEYQGGPNRGASTLISRKKSTDIIPDRKLRLQPQGGPIDAAGRKVYVDTNAKKRNKAGELVPKMIKVNKLAEADDAFDLIVSPDGGTRMEKIYAEHSNKLKSLAGQARLTAAALPLLKHDPSAKKAYAKEVESLDSKLKLVLMNRPLERQATTIAKAQIQLLRQANPNLDGDSFKKIKWQEQEKARQRTGAKSRDIKITPEEWNAIQAGAISDNQLRQILDRADLKIVKELATPRTQILMTNAKTARARTMLASGYTRAEVATHLGVSTTTLDLATNG